MRRSAPTAALIAAGPRMVDITDPYKTAARYTGFADGTTGRPAEKRRVAEPA